MFGSDDDTVAAPDRTGSAPHDDRSAVPAGAVDPAATEADEPEALLTGEVPTIDGDPSTPVRRVRPFRMTIKLVVFIAVVYYFVLPLIPGFRRSWDQLSNVNGWLLLAAFALEMSALWAYSLLTKAALGDAGHGLSNVRMFRIQMSTKALQSIVPGGSAAGPALGYRLLTLSGVEGPSAGFALATAGLGSAVVLNLLFWLGLIISIPVRGVNKLYAFGALAGVLVMALAAGLVFGLMAGRGRAEHVLRWLARRLHFEEETAARVMRQVGERLDDLVTDRALLKRVAFWAAVNWLLDAGSLFLFLRAFGGELDVDALIVAFGLMNILAVIPITPGGLGIVDTGYLGILSTFGVSRAAASLGVGAYRIAQFFFPLLLGGLLYASLRVGPWSIARRERLERLRKLAEQEAARGENRIEFALRFPGRRHARSPVDDAPHGLPVDVADGSVLGELSHDPVVPSTGADVLDPQG